MKYQHTCASIKSSHKCDSWRLNLFGSTLLNGQMISYSLAVGCFKCHNLFAWWKGPSQSYSIAVLCVSKYASIWGYNLCNIPKYVDFSVLDLQSDSPASGMNQNTIFSCIFQTKGMNWGLKLLYPLVLKWFLIMLSGELSDSVDSYPLCLF